jgi:hypothetical protein
MTLPLRRMFVTGAVVRHLKPDAFALCFPPGDRAFAGVPCAGGSVNGYLETKFTTRTGNQVVANARYFGFPISPPEAKQSLSRFRQQTR